MQTNSNTAAPFRPPLMRNTGSISIIRRRLQAIFQIAVGVHRTGLDSLKSPAHFQR